MPPTQAFPSQATSRVAVVSLVAPALLVGVLQDNDATLPSARADVLGEDLRGGLSNLWGSESETGGEITEGLLSTADAAGVLFTFATDDDEDGTATFELYRWLRLGAAGVGADVVVSGSRRDHICQWHPVCIATIVATAGTKVGIAGGLVLDTERYADTLAITDRGYTNQVVAAQPSSPDNASVALKVDAACSPFLSIQRRLGTAGKVWKIFAQKFTAQ